MRIFVVGLVLALGSLLSGCQSTAKQTVDVSPHFLDLSFPDYQQVKVETPKEIFALNDEAKSFVFRKLMHIEDPYDRMKTLMTSIFDRSDFNLLYDNHANTVATETFNTRAANCLSMSIMTYSLAKHAGIQVDFQEVEIPEYWTRREGFSLLNGHINLKLKPEEDRGRFYIKPKGVVVDFYPFIAKKRFPTIKVNKNRVLSMFYNNKGADALLSREHDKAYAYFRRAIMMDEGFQSPWINLGLLYRLTGHYDWAENTYREALKLNPENLTTWENLAILHSVLGQHAKANEIRKRVEWKRKQNPYYHFIQGEEQLEKENWQQAIVHFKKAVRINNTKHQFYFGLAKSYYGLGDVNNSRIYLRKAKRLADYDDQKEMYQGKLAFLTKL